MFYFTFAILFSVAVDNNLRVCTTWGASSYRTFDNLLYSFEGTCAYTLMHDFSADGFRISVINNPDCYPKFKPGGCIRQVIITPESGASYRFVQPLWNFSFYFVSYWHETLFQ